MNYSFDVFMAIKFTKMNSQGNNFIVVDISKEDFSLTHENIIKIAENEEISKRKELLSKAINILNDREKNIIKDRKLSEDPKTLDELSKEYKISRERIRQIENKAFEKLQKHMLNSAKSKNLLPAN